MMNQLESVDQSAYISQSSQPVTQQPITTQAVQQPAVTETVEVIPQPVVSEPVVLQQWTDESGYTWRKMDVEDHVVDWKQSMDDQISNYLQRRKVAFTLEYPFGKDQPWQLISEGVIKSSHPFV